MVGPWPKVILHTDWSVDPVKVVDLPWGQSSQAVEVVFAEYCPKAHNLHTEEPLFELLVPGSQVEHTVACWDEW